MGKGGRPVKVLAAQALGLLLQFYCSALELKSLAQLHGIRKNTASRTLRKAEVALIKSLRNEPLTKITFPSKEKQAIFAGKISKKYPLIKNKFGFVDGKNYRIQEPSDSELQNALYNGWLHSVFVTGVLCFGVDGTLIWAKHNCAGSWNDGDVSRDLQEKLLDTNCVAEDFGIISDTAFPVGTLLLRKIVSPLKENELERAHPDAQAALIQLSSCITSLRQACEWGVGSIEKAWRQLLLPLPYDRDIRANRLENIFRLWNYRVRTTGISQIRSTFFK